MSSHELKHKSKSSDSKKKKNEGRDEVFYELFKSLRQRKIVVELKNGICFTSRLKEIDFFLNLWLDELEVDDELYPMFKGLCPPIFVRASGIRTIEPPLKGYHLDQFTALCMVEDEPELEEVSG